MRIEEHLFEYMNTPLEYRHFADRRTSLFVHAVLAAR
jgi:hypothetical protein